MTLRKPLVNNAGSIIELSASDKLDAVVSKRTITEISNTTPSINLDNTDIYGLTAQTTDISGFTLTGTPVDGQLLWIYIIGTASRAITWGTSFESSTVILPTTTSGTARLDVGFVYNSSSSKWRCVAVA